MIIHATRKLAARLPDVSPDALREDSPLGSWHADRLIIDRRQCVLFCHDETRTALFVPGLRKELFADLGARSFRAGPCSLPRWLPWAAHLARSPRRSSLWGRSASIRQPTAPC